MSVVVRFAPSPTGPLHIGGVRTALYNYLFARRHGGRFILRIEDTDQGRYVPGAEDYIVEALRWCGIEFDEGVHLGGPHQPYRQSERKDLGIYRQHADMLIHNGNAYYAFDTPEDIEALRKRTEAAGAAVFGYHAATRMTMTNSLTLPPEEVQRRLEAGQPYVIRMKIPPHEAVRFHDLVRDEVAFDSSQLDDKILLKADGMPTYHLANVVDDRLMGVTHVIRGEEWLPSTPLHVLMYRAFGWEGEMPKFVHLPLILKPEGQGKLSKRDGDAFGFPVFPTQWQEPGKADITQGFRERGYLPQALINFLALLGWSPGHDEEIMSMARMTELFSLEKIIKSGARFNLDKLNAFQQHYLRQMPSPQLLPPVKAALQGFARTGANDSFEFPGDDYIAAAIDLMRPRITFAHEVVAQAAFFFQHPDPATFDPKLREKWDSRAAAHILNVAEAWAPLAPADWNHEQLKHHAHDVAEQQGIKIGKLMPLLRLAITGVPHGPDTLDVAALLGKEYVLTRLHRAVQALG